MIMPTKGNFKLSDHGRYHFNHTDSAQATVPKYLKMRLKEGGFPPITEQEKASVIGKPNLALIRSPSRLPRATWIGHATMLVQYKGNNFLTDPHFTDYPGPINFLIPKRATAAALTYRELPKIDFIVISHNHYDHLDHRTVDMFGNSVVWYVPLGLKSWFMKRGIHPDRVVEMDWWQSQKLNSDVTVTFAPSIHWSKRTPWDTDTTLWGSWAVKIADFNCWFGGDTAYHEQVFKEIAQRLGPFHLALVPIGAYGPRYFMLPQHLDPAQAVKVHKDLKAARSIPIHWGTFQLTHEPFLEPPRLLAEAMTAEGLPQKEFSPIKIGETFVVGSGEQGKSRPFRE